MRALTVWQPWASAIAELGKNFENRTWPAPPAVIGERLAIHAGMKYDDAGEDWLLGTTFAPRMRAMTLAGLPRGAIVATAVILGSVEESASPWFTGPWGWHLAETRMLTTPVPCVGRQGLWTVPDELVSRVIAAQAPLEGAL